MNDLNINHIIIETLNKDEKRRRKTHGKSKTRVYRIFKKIIQRCYDPNDKDYWRYGAKGIQTDPRYNPAYKNQGIEKAFNNFYDDIGEIADDLSCDRLDNSKGYWKDNIRLADKYVQARNKTNNVVNMELAEEIRKIFKSRDRVTYAEIARDYNLNPVEVRRIIKKMIWNPKY